MSISIDIVDTDVFTALVILMGSILPTNTPVVRGLDNLVSMPPTGFVLMTPGGMTRLGTNVDTFNGIAQTNAIAMPAQFNIGIDFVGPSSQTWAIEFSTLFRDEFSTDQMPANIQPLFADDPTQIPLVNEESQFEQRWRVQAAINYVPTITTAQQSATAISIGLKPIDQTFHP